jgi:hypothetical protein
VKRLAVALLTLVVLAVVPLSVAAGSAAPRDNGIDWGPANWAAGMQMYISEPSQTDPHVHVRFKRVAGEGQRQVRMGERHKVPDSHQWAPYTYTRAVRLTVGQKVVFTTEGALPCEPAKEPLGVTLDMRVKMQGKAWSHWQTWVADDIFLMDC